ncbi:MAG: ribonuclease Z [Clostridia bacterium]|nr:ribonuclease Z [Clostridia bacterium]
MKITFIGTSHGVPTGERFCTCMMLESNGALYFIDAGAPVIDFLLRKNKSVNDLRAVFTTHVHSDHTVGIVHLADLMNWYYKKSSTEFFVTEQEHIDATKQWIYTSGDGHVDESRLKFKVPTAGVVYRDENITVEYIPTAHMKNSYAILVTEGQKRVLFAGDLSHGLKKRDIPSVINEPIDGFVCELAHFTMDELSPYLDECRAKKIFFIHAKPARYEDIRAMEGRYPFEVIAPDDMAEFEL